MKKLVLLNIILVSYLGVQTLYPATTYAAFANHWRAGLIIDDTKFSDQNSMTVNQIQDFLNQKVGTYYTPGACDTSGSRTSEYGGGTRAQYGASHGNPAPFTCLKDYYEVPKINPSPGIPASNYGGAPIPPGAKSAAQIIWDAAQRYNISPKALLVTIQKESAGPLITDDWPFKKQYTYAMGAHCPDTAPCDENYAGFSMQIHESARLFRYYINNMNQPWWPYKKPGINSVRYHPNVNCGSSNVDIQSYATAALYTYTPYQPNQAALNNLYGTGDGCSAYGNRNFWRMYIDWFGPTVGRDVRSPITISKAQNGLLSMTGTANNNQIFNKDQTGWTGWTEMDGGGRLVDVSVTRNQDGRLQVVGTAPDDTIWYRTQTAANSNSWTGWTEMDGGGRLVDVSVTRNQDGRLQVVGTAPDDTIWYQTQTAANSNSWTGWSKMDGLLRNISSNINTNGRICIVGTFIDGTIWYRTQTAANSNSWTGWTEMDGGGRLVDVSVTRNQDGRLQVVGTAPDDTIWYRTQTAANSNSWTGWSKMDGLLRNISSEIDSTGEIQLVGTAANGTVWHKAQTAANSNSWTGWSKMDGLLGY